MGVHPNIAFDKYPKQSNWVGESVDVCFCYKWDERVVGVIVRDDMEEPGETLIRTLDGRVFRATECQYAMPGKLSRKEGNAPRYFHFVKWLRSKFQRRK